MDQFWWAHPDERRRLPHYNTGNLCSLWRWCISSGRQFVYKLLDPCWGRAIVSLQWLSRKLESLAPSGVCQLSLTAAAYVKCKWHIQMDFLRSWHTSSSELNWICLTFYFCSRCSCLLRLRSTRTIACCPFATDNRSGRFVCLAWKSIRLLLCRWSTIWNCNSFFVSSAFPFNEYCPFRPFESSRLPITHTLWVVMGTTQIINKIDWMERMFSQMCHSTIHYLPSSSVLLSRRVDAVFCLCLPPNFINCRTVFKLTLLSDEWPAVAACLLPLGLF